MKGLALLAGLITLLGQMPAFASGDMECDSFYANCSMAVPYLFPENDTRTNLALLQSYRNRILLSQPMPDQTRTRIDPFTSSQLMGVADTDSVNPSDITTISDSLSRSNDDKDSEKNTSLVHKATLLHFPAPEVEKLRDLTPVDLDGRWVSNDLPALEAFFDLLLADKELTDAHRTQLALVRVRMLSNEYGISDACADLNALPESGHAGELRRYLIAATAFYDGLFDRAEQEFSSLTKASQAWVAETARYMLIRVAINQAMKDSLDEYSMFDPAKADKALGQRAIERIADYLKSYPNGHYVDSAAGLYRRAEWIIGDTAALAMRSGQALSQAKTAQELQLMINEVDNKLLENTSFTTSADAPLLMLIQDLKRLRSPEIQRLMPPLQQEELARQQPLFEKAGMQEEFRYLQAAFAFYVQHDYHAVLNTLPMTTAEDLHDTTLFSAQVLRGLALEQQKQWGDAEAHWRHLLTLKTSYIQQQFLQLALARTLVANDQPERVFTPESPVKNLRFRSAILKTSADAQLLRQQTGAQQTHEERVVALHTLLTKQLMHRNYSDFLKDSALLKTITPLQNSDDPSWGNEDLNTFGWDGSDTEEGYSCPSLQETVTTLSKNARDAHALNCLGEFFLRTGTDVRFDWDEGNMLTGLTDARPHYAGNRFTRLDNYMQVIADAKAATDDKSYALYRAIYCFAPSGSNDCGTQDISLETRKAWFRQLKTKYKGSQWARQLKYYW